MSYGSLRMYEIPIAVLVVVTVISGRWLIDTLLEVLYVGRRRQGFRHGRFGRRLTVGLLIVAIVVLTVIACALVLAMIRIWLQG